MRRRISFMGYVIGTLLLASGSLCGAGIISTLIPMYAGLGIIIISLFSLDFSKKNNK
jgi:hypothetical protein